MSVWCVILGSSYQSYPPRSDHYGAPPESGVGGGGGYYSNGFAPGSGAAPGYGGKRGGGGGSGAPRGGPLRGGPALGGLCSLPSLSYIASAENVSSLLRLYRKDGETFLTAHGNTPLSQH